MIDTGTGLTLLGSAIGGAKVIEKILGPTADYIGEQLKGWTEKKVINTSNIFKNAQRKLGDSINADGNVHPKILKGILEEGAWSEEALQVEYFGGVLASSRSGVSRDDRGAYFLALISRLSNYQLRTHYIFYQSIKCCFDGQVRNVGNVEHRREMELFIPYSVYIAAMDFTEEEQDNFHNLMTHSVWGLNKEDLVEHFQYGSVDYLQTRYKDVKEPGIIFHPTNLGVELLMWAYGHGQKKSNDFFLSETQFNNDEVIEIGNVIATKKDLIK